LSPSTPELDEVASHDVSPRVILPETDGRVDQDEEWFEVVEGCRRRRMRMHDYAELFSTPGLYEALVYKTLECRSPERVLRPLEGAVAVAGQSFRNLRVLDLGAGNGIVGEMLRQMGAAEIVGVDILPEAAEAARRDHPEAYDDYLVVDLTETNEAAERRLEKLAPNCVVTVAALGYGDIPAEAFQKVLDQLETDGWLAMCIKDRFLDLEDDSGFGKLIRGQVRDGGIEIVHRERYVHRKSIAGEDLFYEAVIARKRSHGGSRN